MKTVFFSVAFVLLHITMKAQQVPDSVKVYTGFFICGGPELDSLSGKKERIGRPGCTQITNPFDDSYLKNCSFKKSDKGNAVTPRYLIDFDQRTGDFTYLKLKNGKGKEHVKIKKQIRPLANTEIHFRVVAKGGDYRFKAEGGDYFMEYEAAFAQNIQNAKTSQNSENKAGDNSTTGKQEFNENQDKVLKPVDGLYSLQASLVILNERYPVNTVIEDGYFRDLNCLRFGIREFFNIIIPVDSTTTNGFTKETDYLTAGLNKYLVDNKLEVESPAIQTIALLYYSFISKQLLNYREYFTQIQVPDQDFFNISLKDAAQKDDLPNLLDRHFRVSGGFKIDFSAGVFLTGLFVPEFVAQPHTYKYRPVKYTVDPTTGQVTTTFTGELRDTTGNLIHVKNPRMNYAAGFMSHAYIRSGAFTNGGLATGLIVNNEGFQMLLGGSVLFNIRKSRLAFSAGMAVGKQKTLLSSEEKSLWKESYVEGMIDNTPPFFNGSNVPYYEKWKNTWFFGLTYNFSSVAIRW